MHPVFNYLDKTWPFAGAVLAGAMWVGSIRSDVSELQKQQQTAQLDHDAITRLEQGQKDVKETLRDIKDTLSRIEKK